MGKKELELRVIESNDLFNLCAWEGTELRIKSMFPDSKVQGFPGGVSCRGLSPLPCLPIAGDRLTLYLPIR